MSAKLLCRDCGVREGAGAHRLTCPNFLSPGPVGGTNAELVCAGCGYNWSPWCCEEHSDIVARLVAAAQ